MKSLEMGRSEHANFLVTRSAALFMSDDSALKSQRQRAVYMRYACFRALRGYKSMHNSHPKFGTHAGGWRILEIPWMICDRCAQPVKRFARTADCSRSDFDHAAHA